MSGRLGYRSQGEDASIDSGGSPLHRRRVRTQKACDMCHEMKTKCDGAVPCAHCKQSFLGLTARSFWRPAVLCACVCMLMGELERLRVFRVTAEEEAKFSTIKKGATSTTEDYG